MPSPSIGNWSSSPARCGISWRRCRSGGPRSRASATDVDALHQTLAQMKVDYQAVMKRMTDLSSTEDTVLDNVKFLIDELSSVLKKHEA